jgi:hypothetical protein
VLGGVCLIQVVSCAVVAGSVTDWNCLFLVTVGILQM